MRRVESLDPHRDRARVGAAWRALDEAARPGWFLSWSWIEHWLSSLPARVRVRLHLVTDGGEPIAACFVGARRLMRHGLVPSRARFVNATGDPEVDSLTAEHNGLLVRPGHRYSLADLAADLPGEWDELFADALDADAADAAAAGGDGRGFTVEREVPCPTVDLARVRASKGGYLALLSGSTRSQIKRAQRLYEAEGALALDVAGDEKSALALFDELVALHAAAWQARGEAGAFASPWFTRFHRELIQRRFAAGEIQLLRLRSGGATLGCLYNFVHRGTVSFYQSGVAYTDDNKRKPGLLCHAEAIRENAALGHARYDFLGGGARYKRDLCTDDGARLVWLRAQRPRLRFWVERRAREARDRFRARWAEWRAEK